MRRSRERWGSSLGSRSRDPTYGTYGSIRTLASSRTQADRKQFALIQSLLRTGKATEFHRKVRERLSFAFRRLEQQQLDTFLLLDSNYANGLSADDLILATREILLVAPAELSDIEVECLHASLDNTGLGRIKLWDVISFIEEEPVKPLPGGSKGAKSGVRRHRSPSGRSFLPPHHSGKERTMRGSGGLPLSPNQATMASSTMSDAISSVLLMRERLQELFGDRYEESARKLFPESTVSPLELESTLRSLSFKESSVLAQHVRQAVGADENCNISVSALLGLNVKTTLGGTGHPDLPGADQTRKQVHAGDHETPEQSSAPVAKGTAPSRGGGAGAEEQPAQRVAPMQSPPAAHSASRHDASLRAPLERYPAAAAAAPGSPPLATSASMRRHIPWESPESKASERAGFLADAEPLLDDMARRMAGLGFDASRICAIHRMLQAQLFATGGQDFCSQHSGDFARAYKEQAHRLAPHRSGRLGVKDFLSAIRGKLRISIKALSDADAVAVHAALDRGSDDCTVDVHDLLVFLACDTEEFVQRALRRGAPTCARPPQELLAESWNSQQLARRSSSSSLAGSLERLGAATLAPPVKRNDLRDLLLKGVPPGLAEPLTTSEHPHLGRSKSPSRSRSPGSTGHSGRGRAGAGRAAAAERLRTSGSLTSLADEEASRLHKKVRNAVYSFGGPSWADHLLRLGHDGSFDVSRPRLLYAFRHVLHVPRAIVPDEEVEWLCTLLEPDSSAANLKKFVQFLRRRPESPSARTRIPLTQENAERVQRLMYSAAYRVGLSGPDWPKLFDRLDFDSSGGISKDELIFACRFRLRLPDSLLSDADLEQLHEELDRNGNGTVDLEELRLFMEAAPQRPLLPIGTRSRSQSPLAGQRSGGATGSRSPSPTLDMRSGDPDAGSPMAKVTARLHGGSLADAMAPRSERPPSTAARARGPLSEDTAERVRRVMRSAVHRVGGPDWPRLFERLDRDSSGGISRDELAYACRAELRLPEDLLSTEEIEQLHEGLDRNRNGTVDLEELRRFVETPPSAALPETMLRRTCDLLMTATGVTMEPEPQAPRSPHGSGLLDTTLTPVGA